MATIKRRFESLSAIIEYAKRPLPEKASADAREMLKDKAGTEGDSYSRSWYGMESGSEESPNAYAERLLNEGWPEGVERLQEAIKTINDIEPPESMRRRLSWGDHGDSIDMNKVYTGQLDTAWRRAKRQSSKAPAPLTIWLPFSLPASLSSDSIFWRGAAVAALADALQSAGYSVAIMAYTNSKALTNTPTGKRVKNHQFDFVTTVKPHGAPMDISTLAAATALPAMMRGVQYSAEIIAGSEDGFLIAHGLSVGFGNRCEGMEPGDISDVDDVMTAKAAADWVSMQIEKIQNRNSQQLAA